MTKVKNELPVAVHHKSGGSARVRTGGISISLNGVSTASFQVTNGTRYKLFANLRTSISSMLLIGYTTPITLQNASRLISDMNEIADDVPEGTTVYIATVSSMDLSSISGGELDSISVSFYG